MTTNTTALTYTPTLNKLARDIKARLVKASVIMFEVGGMLSQAKGEFADSPANFNKWVESQVGIKKAYSNRLIRVYDMFKDSDLKALPINVLYTCLLETQKPTMTAELACEMYQIISDEVKAGNDVKASDVQEIAEGLTGDTKEPAPVVKTAVSQKELDEVTKRMEDMQAKFEKQKADMLKARDNAILGTRDAMKELEEAKAKIVKLETENVAKDAIIAELRAKLDNHLNTKLDSSKEEELDIPWVTEDEVSAFQAEEKKKNFSTLPQLNEFIAHYADLKASNPRNVMSNTKEAVEVAGGSYEQKGSQLMITLDGKTDTATNFRKLA